MVWVIPSEVVTVVCGLLLERLLTNLKKASRSLAGKMFSSNIISCCWVRWRHLCAHSLYFALAAQLRGFRLSSRHRRRFLEQHIKGHWNRHASIGYLGSIVTVGLSRTVSKIKSDKCKLSPPRVFNAPLRRSPWNFVTAAVPLPDRQAVWRLCPFVLTHYRHWIDRETNRDTDRQTNGRVWHNNIALCVHCTLTCDKK